MHGGVLVRTDVMFGRAGNGFLTTIPGNDSSVAEMLPGTWGFAVPDLSAGLPLVIRRCRPGSPAAWALISPHCMTLPRTMSKTTQTAEKLAMNRIADDDKTHFPRFQEPRMLNRRDFLLACLALLGPASASERTAKLDRIDALLAANACRTRPDEFIPAAMTPRAPGELRYQGTHILAHGAFRDLAAAYRGPRSLSDFGIVGCKSTGAAHFSPASSLMEQPCGGESGKKWPRWGRFWLLTSKVRQAPSSYRVTVGGGGCDDGIAMVRQRRPGRAVLPGAGLARRRYALAAGGARQAGELARAGWRGAGHRPRSLSDFGHR